MEDKEIRRVRAVKSFIVGVFEGVVFKGCNWFGLEWRLKCNFKQSLQC